MHAIPQQNAPNEPLGPVGPRSGTAVRACRVEQDLRGTILRASREAARIFHTDPETLRGLKLTDLVDTRMHPKVLMAIGDAARSGEARVRVTLRRGASFAVADLRIRRVAGGGFVTKLTAMDREPANDPASPAPARSLSSDNLANVSHEIRTPLNAVIGFADALRQESFGPLGDRRYRDYAKLIQESGQHVLELVNDLLDLSKAEADKIEIDARPLRVAEFIESCVGILRLEAERAGLELKVEVAPTVGVVKADPKILRQVLLNLLSNALKFTERGAVTVRARILDGQLVIAVSDTGVGMSGADLQRIGERFYQPHKKGVRGARGSGLGLAISRAMAKAHGGRIDITSEPGSGTTATLTLPTGRRTSPGRYRRLSEAEGSAVLAFPRGERHAG